MATDDFNRADGALGSNWTRLVLASVGDNWEIVSNAATLGAYAEDAVMVWNADSFSADHYAEVTLATITGSLGGSGAGVGVLLRASGTEGSGTFYRVYASADTITTDWFSGGSYQGEVDSRAQAWADGDVLRAECEGTTLRLYHNGTQIGADITDASISSGSPGLAYSSSIGQAPVVDDWTGADLSAGGTDATVTAAQAIATASVVAPPRPRPAWPFAEVTIRM